MASRLYDTVTLPAAAWHIFDREFIDDEYGIGNWDLVKLSVKMWSNVQRVWTGTHLRAQFMMAQAIFEVPPQVEGAVVECGCFLGGSTANLSLACAMTGRDLIVYDSFEGMPAPEATDLMSNDRQTGLLLSDLERVREHVRQNGRPEVCEFRKGWFRDTLPDHTEPVVMALFDVDYQASLHDCMIHLWPKMTPGASLFVDEFVIPSFCALFWSESWWGEFMPGMDPPGLMGSGTGAPLGAFFIGPFVKAHRGEFIPSFKQTPHSLAYARKGSKAVWEYEPPT